MCVGVGAAAKRAYRTEPRALDPRGAATAQRGHPRAHEQRDARVVGPVDGADEVDPQLNLIKGMGGALLREKIVETFPHTKIQICTESVHQAPPPLS